MQVGKQQLITIPETGSRFIITDAAVNTREILESDYRKSLTPILPQYRTTKAIMLNSLAWDVDNLANYVNFDNANRAAAAMGKRLPTVDEYTALVGLPHAWDDTPKGMWFAATADDLATKDPAKCLFFPAVGYQDTSGSLYGQGAIALYWSDSEYNAIDGYYMDISGDGSINPQANIIKGNCFSVRCVQDASPKILTADTTTGDDCTVLTERLIPGEFWLDPDGVTKRQVYQRTFVGTSADAMALGSNIYEAKYVRGYIQGKTNGTKYTPNSLYYGTIFSWAVDNNGNLRLDIPQGELQATPYTLTFKYTKAS